MDTPTPLRSVGDGGPGRDDLRRAHVGDPTVGATTGPATPDVGLASATPRAPHVAVERVAATPFGAKKTRHGDTSRPGDRDTVRPTRAGPADGLSDVPRVAEREAAGPRMDGVDQGRSPTAPDEGPRHPTTDGTRFIFWLFVALAIATAVALTWLASEAEPRFRGRIYWALAGNLALPVVAWFLLRRIHQAKQ